MAGGLLAGLQARKPVPLARELDALYDQLELEENGPGRAVLRRHQSGELVYRLGMAESLYYQDTIERQRRGRPADEDSERRICGGYLVWKFNDSWPQIYSGKVDYFLEPYIPYYAIRRAYAPLLLSFEVGTYVWLWAVNDTPMPVEGEVTVQLFHLHENTVVKQIVRRIRIAPGSFDAGDPARSGRHRHLFTATTCSLPVCATLKEKYIARANALADIERQITFPEARLDVQVRDGALVITTDRFARAVVLEGNADGDEFGWLFEDNWFDLLPGETKIVRVLGRSQARPDHGSRLVLAPHNRDRMAKSGGTLSLRG